MTKEKKIFNREQKGISPMGIYVPRRFFALKDSVLHFAKHLNNDLPWNKYLQGTLSTALHWNVFPLITSKEYDPYCDNPSVEILSMIGSAEALGCFRALYNAREDIREALAEGDLIASAMNSSGIWEEKVPVDYWRSNDGGWRLVITDRVDHYTHVFLKKSDLLRWIKNPPIAASDELLREDGDLTRAELDEKLRITLRNIQNRGTSPTKDDIREEVCRGNRISGQRFNKAWDSVANSPEFIEFTKPGPKKRGKQPKT